MGIVRNPAAAKDLTGRGVELRVPRDRAGGVYELAGDSPYTLTELAAEIAKQSGQPVVYRDLAEADCKAALQPDALLDEFAALDIETTAGILTMRAGNCTTPLPADDTDGSIPDGRPSHRFLRLHRGSP